MLSAVLGLFGSSGFGALLGLIGGLVNRWLDLKSKVMDMDLQRMKYTQELSLREKDKELLIVEWEQRSKVADIEATGLVEAAGYEAMSNSFNADKATYGVEWVDGIRGLVRPLLTLLLTFAALGVNLVVLDRLVAVWGSLNSAEQLALATTTVEWVLFQASIAIGWWFAHRPSSKK